MLLDSVGIHSMVISGDAITPNDNSSDGHAWNIVWSEGTPYHIDFTFDANLSAKKGIIHYDYYNLSDIQIRRDHLFSDPGIVIGKENDWFRENNLFFSKKKDLKEHIRKSLKRKDGYITFRLPFTNDSKSTIDDISELIKSEMSLFIFKSFSYSLSINEAQMVIYIYL